LADKLSVCEALFRVDNFLARAFARRVRELFVIISFDVNGAIDSYRKFETSLRNTLANRLKVKYFAGNVNPVGYQAISPFLI